MPAGRAPRGGDWCEAFAASEHVVALSIGDVCGHGDEKYATMVAVRQTIRDAAGAGLDPAQILAEAHRFLRAFDRDEYATALFALLDTRERTLTFANAGHPPPLMTALHESMFLEYSGADLPLGIEDSYLPVLRVVRVPVSSLLVLYTDGVTEHKRKPLQGAAELRAAAIFAVNFSLLPTADVIEKQMFLTGPNHDDAAILVAWTPAGAGPRRITA